MRNPIMFLAAAAVLLPLAAHAADLEALKKSVSADMNSRITPAIIAAIKEQNAAHASLSQAEIKQLDDQWRVEAKAASRPLIDKTLKNPVSEELKKIQKASGGKYVEMFITDNKGLNVGQTGMTSDYWQGDEPKFLEVFPKGPGALHAEAPEFDDSAGTTVAEVDGTIADGGQAIGTYTVKIKTE